MVALPGKLLVIVLPGPGDAGATVTAFGRSTVADLNVKTAVVQGARLEAANVAARATADYIAFVPAGVSWPEGHLERCIHHLRADLSVGMAGGSASGAPDGALELFVPFGGAVVRHSAFHAVEGFDPAFAVLTDVDFGWRLWLRGYRVRSAGAAPPGVVTAAAPADELEAATRSMLARVLDDTSLVGDAWSSPTGTAARRAAAGRRLVIQRSRARGRRRAAPARPRRRGALGCPRAGRRAGRRGPRHLGCARPRRAPSPHRRRHPRHAGPADGRARHPRPPDRPAARRRPRGGARRPPGVCELQETGFEVVQVGEKGLRDLERVVRRLPVPGLGDGGARLPAGHSHKVVVADVYDPMHLEQLEQGHDAPGERGRFDAGAATPARVLNEQLGRADFFLCASSKQRDLWLGPARRARPHQPGHLRRRRVAALPARRRAVRHRRRAARGRRAQAIRGAIPGIGPDDKVILWGGGVYNWFDPLTLVRAVDRLRASACPSVRLLFLGMQHPNPGVPEMRMAVETQRARRRARPRRTRTCSSTGSGSTSTTARTTCSTPTSA